MKREVRTVYYDLDLKIEAYSFIGIMQQFPKHFHEHYVIGFIEKGRRHLDCNHKEYTIVPGHVVLFNPYEAHTCSQIDAKTLDYRCLNISAEIMKATVKEITGTSYLPNFSQTVITDVELAMALREVHRQITEETDKFQKEENFYLLMEQLIQGFAEPSAMESCLITSEVIQKACCYLEENYNHQISLAMLSEYIGLSKYYLLRSFTRQKGISPYRYLENIRINEAKKLLAEGVSPLNAALITGFADQSHFTNYFKNYIGLTPKQYGQIFKPHFEIDQGAKK